MSPLPLISLLFLQVLDWLVTFRYLSPCAHDELICEESVQTSWVSTQHCGSYYKLLIAKRSSNITAVGLLEFDVLNLLLWISLLWLWLSNFIVNIRFSMVLRFFLWFNGVVFIACRWFWSLHHLLRNNGRSILSFIFLYLLEAADVASLVEILQLLCAWDMSMLTDVWRAECEFFH